MKMKPIRISDIAKESQIICHVRVVGVKRFAVRLWLAANLIRLGAWLIYGKAEVEVCDPDFGIDAENAAESMRDVMEQLEEDRRASKGLAKPIPPYTLDEHKRFTDARKGMESSK